MECLKSEPRSVYFDLLEMLKREFLKFGDTDTVSNVLQLIEKSCFKVVTTSGYSEVLLQYSEKLVSLVQFLDYSSKSEKQL